jgi:DNA-binding transcriptional ArsR family regulator
MSVAAHRRLALERTMSDPNRARPLDLLRRAIHAIERIGATLFLLVAIYCGLVEAIAFTASAATHALGFARERTHHASRAVAGLVDELRKWRS